MAVSEDVLEAASLAAEQPDARSVRAAEESMVVVSEGPGLYRVYSGTDSEYLVDAFELTCECPDHEYRNIECKHIKRVKQTVGHDDVPDVYTDPVLIQQREEGM